ncbi:MAG: VanZ family protein [Bacteroidia bacterium]|nr:VanZ family protein [Bacteroidia bacterium]
MKLKGVRIFATIWTIFIVSFCLLPSSIFKTFSSMSLFQLDKIIHILLYFVFVQLWALNLKKEEQKNKIIILLIGIAYGVIIEYLQITMNMGRNFEIGDMIANTIGCILGVVLLTITQNLLPLLKKYLPFRTKGNKGTNFLR